MAVWLHWIGIIMKCERRLRSEMLDNEGGDGYHRLTNVDKSVEGMFFCLICHRLCRHDVNLHRSTSSPYVLCFECSDEFVLGHGRRSSTDFFNPRHTSSSSPASRYANRHQRSVPPPSPPAPPNLSSLSPPHSSYHLQPDGQDGRSSRTVRPPHRK